MKTLTCVAVLLAALATSEAHLCLVNPTQRGPMTDLNKKGNDNCIHLTSPCGGIQNPDHPGILFMRGENMTLVFQKKLDHFVKETPGYFSVSVAAKQDMKFKELARVADTTAPSLSLITVPLTLSMESNPWYILQVVYMTKNPQAPPAFYQCADFSLA